MRTLLHRLTAATTALALGLGAAALAPASPAAAAPGTGTGPQGQTLTVSQVDGLNPAGTTVTVTGSGYDVPGFDMATDGIYLSLCVDNGPTQAPSPCLGGVDQTGGTATSRWITNNPIGGAVAVPFGPNGTFSTTLLLDAADEFTDCFDYTAPRGCKVVTRVDHRASGNRSQDVKVPVRFTGQPRGASESFVNAAHVDFLGEAPTLAEVDRDTAALAAGQVKAVYLRNMSSSDEWLTAIVNELYQDTLGRDGDASGVAFWIGRLRAGWSVARVAASFYASGEYYEGIGGNSDPTWVNDLYQKILLRTADAEGRAYWVGEIARHGRGNVALRMYQSNESARTRVRGLYQTLLGRAPDAEGLTYWAGQVVVKGDLALAVSLAASAEYQTRAVSRFP